MTPSQVAYEVVDKWILERQRHHAFADALVELFKQNPVPDWKHDMYRAVRESALRKAKSGGYADYAPGGMQHWRKQLVENAREDWGVPAEEVVAIHALIYG